MHLWKYIEYQKARRGKPATAIIKELAKDGGVEISSWDYRGLAAQQFFRIDKPNGLKKAYESAGALLKRSPGADRFFRAEVSAQINANGNVSAINELLNELIPDEFQGQKDEGLLIFRVYERRQFWVEELTRLHMTAGKPAAVRNNQTRL